MTKKDKKTKKTTVKKRSEESLREIKVRVVGVGGGGGSIISGVSLNMTKVSFSAVNTDIHALEEITKKKKIKGVVFGKNLTGGLGTGMDSKLGKEAAIQDLEEVKKLFKDQDIIIFVSSLGGGTGSGAMPVFAKAAKEMGCLVYGVLTLPFSFEGDKKTKMAKDTIKELSPFIHALTVLPNEKIFEIVDKNTPLKNALMMMNKSLADSLEGLVETIYETGLINIDFADVRTILENRKGERKLTYLNTIEGTLEEGAEEVVRRVVSNPLYPYSVEKATGILFNITGGKDIGLTDISAISESISKHTEDDAKIIIGIMQKAKYKDKVRIALLATGCETDFLKRELDEGEDKKCETPKKKNKKKVKSERSSEGISEKITVVPNTKKEFHFFPEKKKMPENEEEKEILEEEDKWEKPSFLRRIS
jgi:cell division protein FtsZ